MPPSSPSSSTRQSQRPAAGDDGAGYVDVTVVFDDLADGTQFEITGDQQGNPPPLRYTVVEVTPVDIDVTFTVCLSGAATTGVPSGSTAGGRESGMAPAIPSAVRQAWPTTW